MVYVGISLSIHLSIMSSERIWQSSLPRFLVSAHCGPTEHASQHVGCVGQSLGPQIIADWCSPGIQTLGFIRWTRPSPAEVAVCLGVSRNGGPKKHHPPIKNMGKPMETPSKMVWGTPNFEKHPYDRSPHAMSRQKSCESSSAIASRIP